MNKADKLKFKALNKALDEQDAKIYIDCNKLCKPASPIYNPWEVLLPILAPTLLALLLMFCVGVLFALVFMIIGIFLYSIYIKKYLYVRLIKRTKTYIQHSYDNMQSMWEYGGIILVNAQDEKVGCVSPDGNWKDFVTLNFADYMLEDKAAKKDADQKQPINA